MAKPFTPNWKRNGLTPLARKVLIHMEKVGDITAQTAMLTYGITSASLARRICDLEDRGIKITRRRCVHEVTGQKFTRYSLGA